LISIHEIEIGIIRIQVTHYEIVIEKGRYKGNIPQTLEVVYELCNANWQGRGFA
jgi:hypothetical protein